MPFKLNIKCANKIKYYKDRNDERCEVKKSNDNRNMKKEMKSKKA